MKYQVLGRVRNLKKGQKPYELVCEFENLVQLFYMLDKVSKKKYSEAIVIDTYTNEIVANQEFEIYEPAVKKKLRR